MKSIKTEIIINASKEIIWSILIDFENYKYWNPLVTRIEGSTKVGQKLSTTIHLEGRKSMDFTPTVLINNTNQEFRWVGNLLIKGIFDGEHYFILEQVSENTTRFIHGENFTGLLANTIFRIIEESSNKGFKDMNEAIKARAEQQVQSKTT